MKRIFIILGLMLLISIAGFLATYWYVASPYPSNSNVRSWEAKYRSNVTDNISDFQGHWGSGDIAAYIYSYHYTGDSALSHQKEIIESLGDFTVFSQADTLLILRQPVTQLFSHGYNEWRFLFSPESRLVTVLYANLDSKVEMEYADELVSKTTDYNQKRKDAEQSVPGHPPQGVGSP